MSTTRAALRDSGKAAGRDLVPKSLANIFGEEDDVMEFNSPFVSLQKVLAEKAKANSRAAASGKRPRDRVGVSLPENSPQVISPQTGVLVTVNPQNQKLKLWLGFEFMERLAIEQWQDELFLDETIADRVTRGISRKEAEELESVNISYPRVPQLLYPSERSDGLPGQHLNLTQLPSEVVIDPLFCMFLDLHIAVHFQLPITHYFTIKSKS